MTGLVVAFAAGVVVGGVALLSILALLRAGAEEQRQVDEEDRHAN